MSMSITTSTSEIINRKSFILGMITAFAECVTNECKKIALSPPFYPEDYDSVVSEAERIADDQGISLWYEKKPGYSRKQPPELVCAVQVSRDAG